MDKIKITLKTFFGLEQVLKEELEELKFNNIEILNRAVQLEGTWDDVYFLNLNVRCALSILVEITKFNIKSEEDLYNKAAKIKWDEYFTVDKTFAVKGAVFSNIFNNSQYPMLVVKDAIVDFFMKKEQERPSVNIKNPQLLFDVYIKDFFVTISLNTSGAPLYQRGYRQETGQAPINEVLAAGMIRLSGWDRKSTFIDPFCGSGTLLIEAAFLASNIPSCIERQHFAFKNFNNFDTNKWEEIQAKAKKTCKSLDFKILGSDVDAEMVLISKRNVRALPIARLIEFSVKSFEEISNENLHTGVLITNPPYGERLSIQRNQEAIEELYENLGSWFKKTLSGFNCWVISSNLDALKFIGLRPTRKIKLFNGDLECSFRKYELYEGSKKGKFEKPDLEKSDLEIEK
jgi:putative N6-adenine-specific DNA methylase